MNISTKKNFMMQRHNSSRCCVGLAYYEIAQKGHYNCLEPIFLYRYCNYFCHTAVENNDLDALKKYLEYNKDGDLTKFGNGLVSAIAKNGHWDMLKYILSIKTDKPCPWDHKLCCLKALKQQRLDIFKWLLTQMDSDQKLRAIKHTHRKARRKQDIMFLLTIECPGEGFEKDFSDKGLAIVYEWLDEYIFPKYIS